MPVPCLVKPPLPVSSEATTVSLLSPAVRVPLPSEIVPPTPDSAPTVVLLPLRSKMAPLLTKSAPTGDSDAPGPSCSMPFITLVPPV